MVRYLLWYWKKVSAVVIYWTIIETWMVVAVSAYYFLVCLSPFSCLFFAFRCFPRHFCSTASCKVKLSFNKNPYPFLSGRPICWDRHMPATTSMKLLSPLSWKIDENWCYISVWLLCIKKGQKGRWTPWPSSKEVQEVTPSLWYLKKCSPSWLLAYSLVSKMSVYPCCPKLLRKDLLHNYCYR